MEVLTKDFAQKQGLDQIEVGVWSIWEGVADRGVMIQLKEWNTNNQSHSVASWDKTPLKAAQTL